MKIGKLFTTTLLVFALVFANLVSITNVVYSAGLQVTDSGMGYRNSKVFGVTGDVRSKVYESVLKGDVDDSGKIDNADIVLLKKYLLDTSTPINKSNADLNGDGSITLTDFSQLQSKVSQQATKTSNSSANKAYNFKVVYPTNGLYSLQPMCAPQKELTVKDASTANNANVYIYAIASNSHKHPSHQKWKVERISGTEWYKIIAENSGKVLNVHNGIAANGTNVDIYPYSGKMHQFRFIDTGNGYYAIQANVGNLNTASYVLDVENAQNVNGANVSIHQFTNNSAQRWRMVRRNAATIKAVEPRTVLKGDVDGNGKVEQADLTLLSKYIVDNTIKINTANADMNGDGKISNTDASQLMMKLPKENVSTTVIVQDGWYKIMSANNLSRGLDVNERGVVENSNIILYQYGEADNQKFYLENKGSGWFTLKAGHCDKYVSAANASGSNYTNVQINSKNNSDTQLWRLIDAGNGYYYVESKLRTGLSFDCSNGGSANGTNIQLWTRGNVLWNKWKLMPVNEPTNWNMKVGVQLANLGNSCYSKPLNPFNKSYTDDNGKYHPTNCTWYAWGRMKEVTGKSITFSHNSGRYANCWGNMVNNCIVDNSLESKCVAVRITGGGGYGHVVFIENISNGYVYYTEANVNKDTDLKVRKTTVDKFRVDYNIFIH